MDPPYGIKFGSNWQVSTRKRDVKDGKAEDATRQPEQIRAFRDTWELGIHSYLAYWRDRLVVARELLTETGSIFVQIGDENVHLVRCLMDEVFGAENCISLITFQKTGGTSTKFLPRTIDYLLWYSRDISVAKFRQLFVGRQTGDTGLDRYDFAVSPEGGMKRLKPQEIARPQATTDARRVQLTSLLSDGTTSGDQRFVFRGESYQPKKGSHWKTTVAGLTRLSQSDRVEIMGSILRYKRLLDDFTVMPITDR